MKITLENIGGGLGVEVRKKGVSEETSYFCYKGVKEVLGEGDFSEIEISRRPFKGAIKIQIKNNIFSSEKGEYAACYDHPEIVANFLNRKKVGNFSFWVKIVK